MYIYKHIYTYICIYFVSQNWFDAREIIGSSILKKAISRVQVSLLLRASTGLVAKGCNELTPLRGFQETWRAHFFFQGWKISTTLEAEGETKSNFGKIMWEFLGESPTWQSLGHIYRHGPEFLLVTHVWVCRTLACRTRTVDVCMLTNGSPPHEWLGRQRWRSDSGTKGSHSLADQAWDQVFAMTQGW